MADRPLFEFAPVPFVLDKVSKAVAWQIKHYSFVWDNGTLFLGGSVPSVPLAKIGTRDGAIYFSLGFVAGRELPFIANEVVQIVKG